MGYLRVNVNKIKESIDLKINKWQYPTSTNCYAFALGLDIPFSNISDHAYKIGCFSEDDLYLKGINPYSLDFDEALFYDLNSLGLSYEEVEPEYVICNKDINYKYFLISLFKGDNDFHFLRKEDNSNIWYHKQGYCSFPKNRDDDRKIIYNPKDSFFINYDYVKTLKIGYKIKR